jgi:hypothetical protein
VRGSRERNALRGEPQVRCTDCEKDVDSLEPFAAPHPAPFPQAGSRGSHLEPNLVAAFERQDFARFVRRGDRNAEALDDLAHLGHLLGIGPGELAGTDP